ncbi:hypothetical protein DFJ58DRAFT_731710 [Suillus subalutaceus]|uniref:uncharacterized protein n=1 Tax=Suillus subalutaceus TaxID=48586 RepID=UPI001B880D2A|nr:uncharacterized protein DFJ58DRAFT_731710 [Suillus subalutaceus]KAG1843291.1 hypothetical protein DFJ58DRAFT_731710 [Suillus subalutaceus]
MIAAAGDGFIRPDHDSIIWRGRFTWAMESYSPRHLRYTAVRAVSDSQLALADIDAIQDENICQILLTIISPALLTAICPAHTARRHEDDEPDVNFNYWRHDAYLRLIMALPTRSGYLPAPFLLAAIFGRVHSSNPDTAGAAFEALTTDPFPFLFLITLDSKLYDEAECITAFLAIVECVEQKDISAADIKQIRRNVSLVMEEPKRRNKCPEIASHIRD